MTSSAATDAVRRDLTATSPGRDVALVSTFAALVAACALLPAITVGAGLVPITLQTFAVMLTGAVLGWRRAGLAIVLYLAVAVAGVPIFSGGRSGPGVFAGPSAGYLVAFPLAAMLAGLLVSRIPAQASRARRTGLTFVSCLAASFATIHPLGILGMMWRANLSLTEAIAADAVFIPGDLVKCAAVAVVATAVLRAFPALSTRARGTVHADR
jgi:biotin transport system substrate-specific component